MPTYGHGYLDENYKMGDTVLGTTVKEKDLGVIAAWLKASWRTRNGVGMNRSARGKV